MSLLQRIKDDSVLARKNKHELASFMITLYSESAMIGKNKRNAESTNEEVISVLKKFKAGAETIIVAATKLNNTSSPLIIDKAKMEIFVVEQYLPKMMTESELKQAVWQYINKFPGTYSSVGAIMTQLKHDYPGQYDGAIASNIIKELCSGHNTRR